MPTILDAQGWAGLRVTDSGYEYDLDKLDRMPSGWAEMDGYRDRWNHTDSQIMRMYIGPWSSRRQFRQWALGWVETVRRANLPNAEEARLIALHNVILPEGALGNHWGLRRELPAQDPEHPWLFASECETVKGEGAWIDSTTNEALRADGRLHLVNVVGPDGPQLGQTRIIPAIHYVDNSLRGGIGRGVGIPGGGDLGIGTTLYNRSEEFKDGRCVMRVTFRARPYAVLSDERMGELARGELGRYVERTEDFNLEAIPLNRLAAANLRFAEGAFANNAIPEAGVMQLPSALLTYTWHDVTDPPRAAYSRVCGKINDADFDGLHGAPVYPAQTLLCLAWKVQRNPAGPTGRVTHTIRYRFAFRPQKWNRFPAADGNFYLATFGGGANGETVYKTADYGDLFTVRPPVSYV